MGIDEPAGNPPDQSRRLPLELAELLTPPLEHALNHPLRRDVLRALNRAGEPLTAPELAASIPVASITLINYHAAVLERCDLLRATENAVAGDGFGRRYASNVAADVQIIAILGATETMDKPA